MSSSIDVSDEEEYSVKSGSASPAPGDTLPWNLPRHERSKRKIQGGSILDPAERAVLRIADERDRVQKKTFTKWINQHLFKVRKHINDLYEDLRDGHNLISLLEVLSGDTLRDLLKTLRLVSSAGACGVEQHGHAQDDDKGVGPREKGRMRFHRLQNVQIALDYLKRRQVKLVNIRNDDITDGNPKLTLGLIWTIILHFQISEIHVAGQSEDMTAKERLLFWSKQMTDGYVGVRCDNFTTSWRDGRLFNAIIHKYRPDLVDMSLVSTQSNRSNLEQAFDAAEQLGVARLLDPEDVDVQSPDEKSVITYVSTLYDSFPKVPDGGDGINANDVDIKWVEYQNMIKYLSQWIKHNVTVMSDRAFPNNPVELKALYTQYLQFKEHEIPLKENEKTKINHLYEMLEVWIEFGRIQLPAGHHPNDIEKEWGKLIVAMLEREKSLRPEVERWVEAGLTTSLSRDAKRLEAGIQFQNEAEIAGYLLECENTLRQQVMDIQMLLDGKFPFADQLVQRVSKLRDDLLSLRTECSSVYNQGRTLTPMSLQHLKHAQILKPLVKPSLLDTDMTEGEANMNFVQDLLNWVEEMQVQVDRGEWGTDLPSVETQIDDFKSVHQAIEEFQTSLKEAKHSEFQMTVPLKHRYSEKLSDLESNYEKLLNCSRKRQSNLEKLHDFVSRATQELIWLNEKEEEEVAFDWSDRNGNINNKRDYHADLMRELEEKEEAIKSVQDKAESLMLEQHPARPTIEAYRAAMQTQWNWILQLCSCVEQHLKENAVYFEFFGEAKESLDRLKNLQDAIHRKYSCDRTSSLHKLEDLVQESMEEKEQLLQYSTTVAGLVGRAKTIVQLRPRNPDSPVRSSIPVKAICDYRQIEITIFKDDECVLASNAHRAKWKVINPGGNEAMVPSVCFTVPPPNKEALEMASRIEQTYQNVLSLWHHSHVNMKSVVSWHYLMADIRVKTLLSGAHQQEVLSNLDSHFEEFLADSEESEVFTVADRAHSEREVEACKQYYEELLRSAEREEHEESQYNHYISEVRNFRMHLEAHEEHLIRKIRTPLDRDDLEQSQLRISEQEMSELDQLKGDLEVMKEKCEVFLKQASTFPSLPTLSSELLVLVQNMGQVYSMSSIFMDKLKTVSLVVENSQRADALVKVFESKLYEEDAVNCDLKSIETVISTLKHWRSEMDEQQEVFHDMEDELKKARSISERMFKVHNERDFDLDWHREKADQLSERWHSVHSQIDNRSVVWVRRTKPPGCFSYTTQLLFASVDCCLTCKSLWMEAAVLVAEIEQKQSRITECQKHSEQYSSAVKDYELQLMTYRAMVDSQHKSPLKKRRMQNSSDAIQQEFMDLRTRYTALVTLMTQCVKFASETLRRAEEEEVRLLSLLRLNEPTLSGYDTSSEGLRKEITVLQRDRAEAQEKSRAMGSEVRELKEKLDRAQDEAKLKHNEGSLLKVRCKQMEEQLDNCKKMLDELKSKLELQKSGFERQLLLAQTEMQQKIVLHQTMISSQGSTEKTFNQNTEKSKQETQLQLLQVKIEMDKLHISLAAGKPQSFEDAIENGHIDALLKDKLKQAHLAFCGYLHGDTTLPVLKAIEARLVDRCKGNSYLEVQIAAGGVVVPEMGVRVPADIAVDRGLLTKATLQSLYEPVTNPKKFYNPDTRQKAYYGELLNTCVYDVDDGVYLLPFGDASPTAASSPGARRVPVISSHRGTEMSAYEAYKGKHISQMTYLFLPIAGLWDATQKKRFSVFQAVQQNLVDRVTALRLQQTDVGLLDGGGMTADEAVQCDLMRHSTTLIVLDKQKGFTGLLIPSSDEITIVSSWSEHRQLDSDYSSTLLRDRPKIAAFYIPENDEVVDIDSATKLGFIDHHTAELLKSIEFPAALPDIEQLNAKFSSWLMLRELTLDGNRASGDLESSIGHPRTPSPSEMRQLLTSYLMMNSYLDTKSEQRLVVLDRRLTNMVQHLVEDLALSESQEPMYKAYLSDVVRRIHDKQEALGVEEVHLDPLPDSTQPVEGGTDDVTAEALLKTNTQIDGQCTQQANVDNVAVEGVNIDALQKPDTQHGGAEVEGVKVDVLQQTYTQQDERGAEQVRVNASEEPNIEHEGGGVNRLNIDRGVEGENADTLHEPNTNHEEKRAEQMHDDKGAMMNGVALQKVNTQHDEGDTERFNVEEGVMEEGGRDAQCIEDVNVDLLEKPDTEREAAGVKGFNVEILQETYTPHEMESNLQQGVRLVLEDVAFDVQSFVSENTEFLSSAQSKHILKLLSTTQRAFREQTETVAAQRQALEGLLDARERDTQQQKEFASKLDELCDSLTLTENRLMGHQHEAGHADSVSDLQQYQQEHQALQKDVLTNAGALNDVISSTKKFLEENRAKMSPEQVAAVEKKLEEAKSKAKLINQRAEESRKDLEKVVTTAIKQESEKTAAVEQLEESKNKIEGLLGWISNIGNEKEAGTGSPGDVSKENGNLPEETSAAGAPGEEEEKEDDARHQEILSQQQELIMATQSAQALLDKQAQVLAPEEQEKLQRDVQELRARYDASLTQAEQQMKQVQSVQEELGKFQGDSVEFEAWLDQAEAEMEELCAPGDGLDVLAQKLQRQKSFSEDVISHKGDLRFITISGQKVLDVAKACSSADAMDKGSQLAVDTSGSCASCNSLASNLKDVVDKYTKYEDSSAELVKWLNSSEEEARRQQSEAIAADPQTLQIQLEDTKACHEMPFRSASLQYWSLLKALGQDIASRQSSISAIKAKVEKFAETADASAAAPLQSKMESLSRRLADTCDSHNLKVSGLEEVKDKVERFEKTAEEVQQFVQKRSQELLAPSGQRHAFPHAVHTTKPLSPCIGICIMISSPPPLPREEEVSSCQDQLAAFRTAAGALTSWLEETDRKVPTLQPGSGGTQSLEKDLLSLNVSRPAGVCCGDVALSPHVFRLPVTSCAEERKQHLERSSRNLEAFHTAEPQLRQWLSEKELMMTVLGPLSVDLNMLKMQKQQVQILQNEFESRKPQYEELHKAAAAILDPTSSTSPTSPSSSSSEVQAVTEQLAGVTQKWEDVTGQLGSRAGLIDQAALKTGQLQELLKGLGAASGRLDAQLSGEQGQQHSTQPDAVKKQLEQVHSISAQLREERRRLKEAEAVATELTAMVTEDYLKADLARQLESVSKPFKQLEEKAAKRAQQLASTFDSSQQFHRASEEFQTWLDERLREEASPRPVSAQVEPLQRSLTEHEALRRALSDHERPYATIAGEGEALLQDTDGAEKLALQGQLATLSSNWEAVKKGSADRGEALATALQRAVRYRDQAEKLSAWAEECEASRDRVQTAVDPVALESSLSQLKALQKDVDKHRGAVEQLNAAADSLLEAANADTDGVKEERAALGERVDKLAEGLQSKRESLEKTSQTLKDFNDTRKEAKSQIERAQKQVEAYESLGAQAHSTKTLTNMKAQQKSLEAVQSQLEQLKNLAKDLVVDVPDADGVTDLLLQADGLEKDYGSLNKKVEETCSTLEGKLQGIGQFQNDIREMYGEFTDLDDELDGMEPVALDLAALKDQQEGIQGFTTKLREVTANTVNAGENCRKMLETESSPELFGLKRDVDALSKQCGKLLDRARGREEQVVEARRHLEELHSKLRRSGEKLSRAVATEEAQGVVAVETEVINQQLEAFKVFEKEEIEPLQTELQDINSLGQALIQGAAKASSTQGLEDELDSINAKWNTLNKKVAERSAQLHEALLHCGRFQDALESLLSWLTDTEELVANQKAPSAEFKVVKAQIQEQKLLQRLLDDRKPTVELIKKEGGKVAELAESVDRDKVAREMEGLGQRWDTLLKKAENRHKQLESILVVTQKFHETLEPLSDWLQATEKHLANSEPIGTESSKLEKQISQQKALEEEILSHSRDLCQALSLGQMLRGAVSAVDDVDLVQVRLDATQASYIELQERCRRRADTLRQALANARLFGEDEVALMNWLSEAHGRLSEAGVQDPRPDALEEQLAEQRALQEDIKLRRQNVDQAIANGMELLKQTTGDEVVAIQGKLDGIKTKYAEIDTMSRGVCDNLQRVLGLSTELQGTHQELDSWLGGVEAEVSSFAGLKPVGEELTQAQDRQKALLKEAKERKPLVDKLNELSGSLLDLVPWHAREGLDKLVTADNERYRALSDAVTQHVDRINADMLKSQQFGDAADAELAWLSEAQDRLQSMGEIRLEQDQTLAQLQAQKVFSMDIMRHKDSVDELVKTGKAIMDSKSPEEKEVLQAKSQALVERYAAVCQLNSERCLQLERAQSLAGQFWETYEELCPWLQDTLAAFSQLHLPAIEYETLRRQQEELRQMRELIAEHKPHIDKMNKTGPQLLELSPLEGEPIREKYTATDRLYAKLKADVTQRAATLDEAISKSTQFHDKIDPMLESLERMSERLRQPPSISVEVEKIREQLTENKAGSMDLEKLQPSYEMLRQRGEEMIARSEGADKDLSAKAVQDKLDQMVFLWQDIQALQEEREAKLLDVMDLADKFWCEHCALLITTKDSQDLLKELEEPGVDPSVVKQQLEFVEGFKEEIDGLQEELEVVQNLGTELMTACGEPDKPIMKKSLDEVNLAWENLDKTWKERVERLEEAMQAAVQFQDGLQGMFDWVDILESKLDSMPPVGTDVDTVKQQLADLKEYKGEAYQLQIELERLNHAAGLLLKKVTDEADRSAIQEPMAELKMLWDNLDEKIINRQHKLEGGLLALGQFQHALDELLAWMSHTDELLGEQRKAGGDPKAIEIELAKHHVLENDVLAHKTTVETVQRAGGELVQSSAGEEASALQTRLDHLNQRWTVILERTGLRRQQLESSLLQAQGFHGEIEDMQQWLKDTERQLLASKAVGGLPDTAREQLSVHLELCAALEAKEELYGTLVTKGQQLLTLSPEGLDSNTEQDLANLRDKWGAVRTKVAERKVKLEEALTVATDFHDSLQDFINWLTQAEQTLTMVSPASLIMDTVMFQIDEHKMFVTEVNGHRDHIIELDKTGTHLKYFSQKQDVVLIKNLLVSVQARWEKLLQRSVERGRMLDDARKRAKQFHETWTKLMDWLEESEKSLDSEVEIANDPDRIKAQLAQHKEFQKAVGSKHAVYDTTARTGRALKDKTGLKDDKQKLDDMLSELRDKWDTVCGKSVERQNKLEEALLISGQFTEALQALIDWLYKVEPQMAEDQPVHGDIDLVLNLIDNHKVFQKELGKRTVSVAALKRSARELLDSSHDDPTWVRAQMGELGGRWDTVCTLSVSKQSRLEQALGQAEEFHSTVHILLEWLAEAEQSLRFHGSLPDDEDALRALIEQHEGFMKKLEEKRAALNKATSLGEDILTICHPDSITTIKHWNTIIKARFEEVQAWARQHQQRLATALEEQQATAELLKGLLTWLQWAESSLDAKDKEALPQELEEVKGLIAQHQTFMEEMTRKQPDVDIITKTHKRKNAAEPAVQSQIPVLEKGRPGRDQTPLETKNPQVNLLVSKWQQVWLLALDRRRKLNDALDRLEELKEFDNFDFDVWRKKYMRWMNHKKSRVMDFFRRIDKDQDGKVTREEFIEGILSSRFPTSRLEMSAVADIFDRDGDGFIDYYEFVAALHPNKEAYKPLTDADKIEDEVTRQVAKCKCPKRFQVEQIGANKYRFYLGNQFGDSQQLRLVRILRSTVMVRVGGGWMALDEFLVKNDPCRVHHHGSKMLRSESNSSITQSPLAKGRTNLELREKFILPEGTTQIMASFRYRGRRSSRPSSRAASPNRSTSSHSCPAPAPNATPVTTNSQAIVRNYDKPWLVNSKPSSPLKSSDGCGSPGSSKNPSQPGSRGSSRRGSDASDFDISDIQSVCSDASENVGEHGRPSPRGSAARQHGGKPSKIPTPKRRATPTSKLAKGSKR
uniref:Dystonin n=1 Tax=Gadus morhua TaxID=8049 RepID=A0A8C5B1R8_GADMO